MKIDKKKRKAIGENDMILLEHNSIFNNFMLEKSLILVLKAIFKIICDVIYCLPDVEERFLQLSLIHESI